MARGRPKIEIDQQEFESLLAIQCTIDEIVAFYEHKLGSCSKSTIERWCKRTYKENFDTIFAKKRAFGKVSLRRSGWQLAMKNPAVHIFYCKNFLGMTDKQEIQNVTLDENTRNEVDNLVNAFNSFKSNKGNSD